MKKNLLLLMTIGLALVACSTKTDTPTYPFYLGTYTEKESEGIYKGILNSDGTFDSIQLAAKTTNPSYLCFANQQQLLIAVNEVSIDGTGTVESYRIEADGLKKVSSSKSGGAHPCHVTANSHGDVLMANYSGGNIGYVQADAEGNLSPLLSLAQHYGKGGSERQTRPHAHSTWFIDEQQAVAVDLGIDQLIFYRLNGSELQKSDSLKLANGAGPRHLAMHPGKELMYVVNELNSTVTVVAKTVDGWQVRSTVSTLPAGYSGESYCADIHVTNDGRFVYASNRGHNSLAIFEVMGEQLELAGHEDVRGDWPRNFALTADDKFVVVANQRSDNLVAFQRNRQSGLLTHVSDISADTPVCVLFE
ncbi:lactonase family protein [Carboxylicivirga taeanensis]|uniref:lactonase family protein n=1 Tax=Carboxylicivirga taeanensis TaxID=1416875 RepID=UPI003F6E154F